MIVTESSKLSKMKKISTFHIFFRIKIEGIGEEIVTEKRNNSLWILVQIYSRIIEIEKSISEWKIAIKNQMSYIFINF